MTTRDEHRASAWRPEANPYASSHSTPSPGLEAYGDEWQFDDDLAQLLAGSAGSAGSTGPAGQSAPGAAGDVAWADVSYQDVPYPDAPYGDVPYADDPYDYEYQPPTPRPAGTHSHRRRNRWLRLVARLRRPGPVLWLRWLSLLFASTTAAIVTMVSVLGGMISYDPMRHLATLGVSPGLAGWWPLLVFGPWVVASLSILRAAVHQRRVPHSWAVVVLFSAIAVYLCVAHAQKTVTSVAVAGLPPITALVSFHQLVRQITLTNPPKHALPRQRGTAGQGGS